MRQKLRRRLIALTIMPLLNGCDSESRYPEGCAAIPNSWAKPSDGYNILAVTNRVSVERDGRILWNGVQISREQLNEYAAQLPELDPVPFTIVEIQRGASCELAGYVRRTVNDRAKCMEWGRSRCGEGAGPWSIIGDVVGPDGQPVIVGTEDEFRAQLNEVEANSR